MQMEKFKKVDIRPRTVPGPAPIRASVIDNASDIMRFYLLLKVSRELD